MITKKQFKAYENVRLSGVPNMLDIKYVMELSDLTRDQIKEIMHNYTELKIKYCPKTII
jgi:hypothetical protein